VTSFSQAGTLTFASAGETTGLNGKLTFASSGGKRFVPANVRSSKTFPFASRYGEAAFET